MPPAARVTDMHTCPMVTGVVPHVGGPIIPPCEPTVIIGDMPAARVTDHAICVGPPGTIIKGSPTVFINGKPAARIGDMTAHGGVIVVGFPTVIIGEMGMGGTQGATLKGSRQESRGPLRDLTEVSLPQFEANARKPECKLRSKTKAEDRRAG